MLIKMKQTVTLLFLMAILVNQGHLVAEINQEFDRNEVQIAGRNEEDIPIYI